MPVRLNTTISWFDGPPVVSCAAFNTRDGKLAGPIDAFDHPFWDRVRAHISDKAMDMRRQGFFGAAMLPMNELEYTGIMEKLEVLEKKFTLRDVKKAA
jgi:fructose 1,6-bisphosphate aldolase/phosphatase